MDGDVPRQAGEPPMPAGEQIQPLRLYPPGEMAELLGLTETQLLEWSRQTGIRETSVFGSRRYWGYDVLLALGRWPLPHQSRTTGIQPNLGYSAREAASLLGGVEVEAFLKWAAGRAPVLVVGDRAGYLGRDLLMAVGLANRPPLDRIEPNAVYTREEAELALRMGKGSLTEWVKEGVLRPIRPAKRRQLFLGSDLLGALRRLIAERPLQNEDETHEGR